LHNFAQLKVILLHPTLNNAIESTANKNLLKLSSYRNKSKDTTYLLKASGMKGPPVKSPYLHCQTLNEVWEDPGSTLSGHSCIACTCVPWVGLALLPGAQSLLQAVT